MKNKEFIMVDAESLVELVKALRAPSDSALREMLTSRLYSTPNSLWRGIENPVVVVCRAVDYWTAAKAQEQAKKSLRAVDLTVAPINHSPEVTQSDFDKMSSEEIKVLLLALLDKHSWEVRGPFDTGYYALYKGDWLGGPGSSAKAFNTMHAALCAIYFEDVRQRKEARHDQA